MLKTLLNPVGIVLLIASLALVVLMLFVWDRGSGPAISLFFVGLIAYAASTAVIYLQRYSEEPQNSDTPVLFKSTEWAIRRINKLPDLSRSDLIDLIPSTLSAVVSEPGVDAPGKIQTHLEKSQALREVLILAIEKLRPPVETKRASADHAIGFHILREFYVEGKTVKNICVRHSVSEAAYYRQRKNAVEAISRDLETHEALLNINSVKG